MAAASPEQLDELLEDAVLLGDAAALSDLLDLDVVLVGGYDTPLGLLRGHLAGGPCARLVPGLAVTVSGEVVVVSRQGRQGWTGVVVVRRTA